MQAPGVDWHNSSLAQLRLDGANLMLANLSDASLLHADLTGANLQKTILIQAKLSGATFTDGRICAEDSVEEYL